MHTHILAASGSAVRIRLPISSDLARIVYMLLMFASMLSVSFVTLLRYVSTLSAVIEEMECSRPPSDSVSVSTAVARYWASHSMSLITVTST